MSEDITSELNKLEREQELEIEIEKHNKLYWEDNEPEIDDTSYDLLVVELYALNPDSHIFSVLETQKSVETQNKYVHSDPMLSLEKFYSKQEVIAWMKKIGRDPHELFKMELKLDGISGRLENGSLATRGDGRIGENHTSKISFIEFKVASDKTICETIDCTVNGEIIITDKFFETNLKGEFKNSRNAVAGLMGRKRPEEIEGKGVTFIDFDYDEIQHTGNVDAFEQGWDDLIENLTSKGFPYDGIVIKLADTDYYKQLGNKTKAPKGAIAFKFANKSTITTVKSITWQVSRNGRLTPVAELEPIDLAGVTISRATCHNYENVFLKNISPNAIVKIERAGDVIPKLVEVVKSDNIGVTLTECPCCEAPTEVRGVDLFCTNEYCSDRVIENIVFMSRTAEIDELGRPTAEKIFKFFYDIEYNITNITDLDGLEENDILEFEGYGAKSAKTLFDNIQKSLKNINEIKFLASFGVDGVGRTMFNKLLTRAGSIAGLLLMSREELISIDGVGEKLADNFLNAVDEQAIDIVYMNYCNEIVIPRQEHNNIVEGQENTDIQTICFTGKMSEGRKHYEAIAEGRGLKPTSSVSKTLDILVISEAGWTSGKVKKAEKYGTVEIIALEDWLQ